MSSPIRSLTWYSNQNQEDASQEGNEVPPPSAEETTRLRAVNEQQKTEIDKMSSTFKAVLALKNRKIKELEDQMEQLNATHVDNVPEMDRSVDYVVTPGVVQKLNEIVDARRFDLSHPFWSKVSLYYGDITQIHADVIVNATNLWLAGKDGVSGVVHRAAGYDQLHAECKKHTRPVATGQAVMTESCGLLPRVRKIIHCVGPICHGGVTDEARSQLESCYRRAIELCEQNGLRSIAFTCISTGIHGYDNKDAARIVLRFLYEHLDKARSVAKWDRIILCIFMDVDKLCYKHYITKLARNPELFDEEDDEE